MQSPFTIKEGLRTAGLDDEFLGKNLISIANDGASVLTGKITGVIARLKHDFQTSSPYIAWPIALNWLSMIL